MTEPEYYARHTDRPQWGAALGCVGALTYLVAMLGFIAWLLFEGWK